MRLAQITVRQEVGREQEMPYCGHLQPLHIDRDPRSLSFLRYLEASGLCIFPKKLLASAELKFKLPPICCLSFVQLSLLQDFACHTEELAGGRLGEPSLLSRESCKVKVDSRLSPSPGARKSSHSLVIQGSGPLQEDCLSSLFAVGGTLVELCCFTG